MPRYDTAGQIINDAAVEVGLTAVDDPFASTSPAFIQLRTLLTSAGRELLGMKEGGWQRFIKSHAIETGVTPGDGVYALPDDYAWFIDQTGWTPTDAGWGLPLGGPLSAQDWTYLVATNLASSTIYVSFRVAEGTFNVLPLPPPDGIEITFEYMSRNWAVDVDGITYKDRVTATDDTVLYEPVLIMKLLKLRFLEAKGFDTTAALGQFQNAFMTWAGEDVPSPVLDMVRNRIFPYLTWRNVPQTNFGLP